MEKKKNKKSGRLTMIRLSNDNKVVVKESFFILRIKLLFTLSGFIKCKQQVRLESMSIDRPDKTIYENTFINKRHIIEYF